MRDKKMMIWLVVFGMLFVMAGMVWAAPATNIQMRKGKVYLNLRDADIKSVLQIFAKATKTNIIAADDVKGTVTVTFTGIAPKKGLEAVLRTKGLDWFEEEGTLYVSTKKILRTYYLENARPSDIKTIVENILPTGSMVSVDDSYNVLVIQTSSDYLPRLERLIKELDVLPTQVMIEVRMIELKHTDGGKTGVDIKYTNPSDVNDVIESKGFAEKSSATDPEGFYAHILSGDIETYLSALQTAVSYNVVATPRLTTLSNREASLLIGQKLGYKNTVITDTTTTQQIEFLEVGTSLSITPVVTKGGYIRMVVAPKLSDGTIINDLPQENTTETRNEVMVRDGQTFVIGGLLKDKDTQTDYGIPFIMDIPLIGAFFRRTVVSKEKQELLVFVTPHILTAKNLKSISSDRIKELEEKSAREKARLIH